MPAVHFASTRLHRPNKANRDPFNSFFSQAAAAEAAAEEDVGEWSDEMEVSVARAMFVAFDNYQNEEVQGLLSSLVDAARSGDAEAERSLYKLAVLTKQLERLERAVAPPPVGGGMEPVMAQDEARTIYSQIRMWGKDGEKYQKGSWLGWLEDLRKGL